MKLYVTILFTIIIALQSCKSEKKEETNAADKTAVKPDEKTEEPSTTTATLTPEQIKTVGIEFGNIEQKDLTATLKANGVLTVPNNNKANATSLYGGVIKTLNVQIGSYVKKGQVIATIANPQFIQLQEEYLTIGSKIIFAQQELERQKELYAGNAGAKKNLQSAEADIKTLHTRKASLQQQIQLMGINPSSISNSNLRAALVVTSPISGTVSNVFSKIGSYTDVSTPVAEIVDNGSLHLDLNVFEKDLPTLRVGQTIHFTLTNNTAKEYDAEVYSIGTSFQNDSKTIPVHATVKGNKTGLIDGMNITAIVSLNNVTTPAVPNDAIISHEGKDYIFVLAKAAKNGETNFIKSEIVKGISNLGYTAITLVNEIPQDSKVVTKGTFFVNAKLTNVEEE